MNETQFYILVTLIIVFSFVPCIMFFFPYKKLKWFSSRKVYEDKKLSIIQEIHKAIEVLKKHRKGGTFIIDRFNDVNPYVVDSQILDAKLSSNLLINIFEGHSTPLHDGAVIISKEGNLKAASAYITRLSAQKINVKKMGTRHRSALGLSEVSEAIIIVLSEELGTITIFKNGIQKICTNKDLMQQLFEIWIQ